MFFCPLCHHPGVQDGTGLRVAADEPCADPGLEAVLCHRCGAPGTAVPRQRDAGTRLPGRDVVAAAAPASALPLAPEAPACAEVLIVDDDMDLSLALACLLEDSGLVVTWVPGGHEALRYLKGHRPPRVMVVDLMMPGVSGRALCEAIATDERWRSVHLLVFTAAGDRHLAQLGLSPAQVVRKPLGVTDLITRVETLVGRRSA
jgi:CheY-like chemotaxis protein